MSGGWESRAKGQVKKEVFGQRDIAGDLEGRAWLEATATRFLGELEVQPPVEPRIRRAAATELCSRIALAEKPITTLVHGLPGAGKSFVLADVVAQLSELGSPVLAIRVDQCDAVLKRAEALRSLKEDASAECPVWIVDQLEQLSTLGSGGGVWMRSAERLFALARELKVHLLVSCRSVDALPGSRLRLVIDDRDRACRRSFEAYEIGPLDEGEVEPVLNRLGVPWISLSMDAQELIRNPFCLYVFSQPHQQAALERAGSIQEVASAWLDSLAVAMPKAPEILDDLLRAMDQSGRQSALRGDLSASDDEIESLIGAGLLSALANGRVRATHQISLDARRVQQLGRTLDPAAVAQRLGPRDAQTLSTARSVRDACFHWVAARHEGAVVMDTVMRSEDVRPVVKRGLLLGLAARVELDQPVLEVVRGWLETPQLTQAVRWSLLRANSQWMRRQIDWVNGVWESGDSDEQAAMLGLLGSISDVEGEFVAEWLGAWAANDPSVFERARSVFAQDPILDSERLFNLRMSTPSHMVLPFPPRAWRRLFQFAPKRAIEILKLEVQGLTVAEGSGAADGGARLPAVADWQYLDDDHISALWTQLAAVAGGVNRAALESWASVRSGRQLDHEVEGFMVHEADPALQSYATSSAEAPEVVDDAGELDAASDLTVKEALQFCARYAAADLEGTLDHPWHLSKTHMDRLIRLIESSGARGDIGRATAALDVLDQMLDQVAAPLLGKLRHELG